MTFDQLVEHVGISKDLLDQQCSDEHLREISDLLQNWLNYANALKLSSQEITGIRSDSLMDTKMKGQEVLRLWKKANAFKATYASLIRVCLSERDTNVAEKVCEIKKSEGFNDEYMLILVAILNQSLIYEIINRRFGPTPGT